MSWRSVCRWDQSPGADPTTSSSRCRTRSMHAPSRSRLRRRFRLVREAIRRSSSYRVWEYLGAVVPCMSSWVFLSQIHLRRMRQHHEMLRSTIQRRLYRGCHSLTSSLRLQSMRSRDERMVSCRLREHNVQEMIIQQPIRTHDLNSGVRCCVETVA